LRSWLNSLSLSSLCLPPHRKPIPIIIHLLTHHDSFELNWIRSLHYAPNTSVLQTEELFDLLQYLFSLPLSTPEYADGVRCTVALMQSSAQVFATISDSLVEDLAISLLQALHSFPASSIDHVLSIYLSIMQTVAKSKRQQLVLILMFRIPSSIICIPFSLVVRVLIGNWSFLSI
jgi:hypothetical protein